MCSSDVLAALPLLAPFHVLQETKSLQNGDEFGIFLAAAHDLNADGVPDLVVADPALSNRVSLWFVSGCDGSVLARQDTHGWGGSVDFVGDLDGDGRSEVGAVSGMWMDYGRVDILSGKDGAVLRSVYARELGVHQPGRVRAAGRIDGDDVPDYLVQGVERISGSVVAVSGGDGHVIWRWIDVPYRCRIAQGIGTAWCYGQMNLAAIGDVDADGRDDFAVSDFGHESDDVVPPPSARVVVLSGRAGTPLYELRPMEDEPWFGSGLDGAFDFDADRRPDIVVGSPEHGSPMRYPGRVRIYSGRDGSLLRSIDRSRLTRRNLDQDSFGETVRILGDLNGDGLADLLVGAPEDGLFEGTVYVVSGADGTPLHAIDGRGGEGDYYVGRTLVLAGDLDQDGIEDFAVSNAVGKTGPERTGLVRAYSGKTGALLLSFDREALLRR